VRPEPSVCVRPSALFKKSALCFDKLSANASSLEYPPMIRGATGRHEVSTTAGEAVRAFVPNPLPPHPPLDLSGARQRLLERALLACGRLDGVSALLPEKGSAGKGVGKGVRSL
jgi:hypothetical protein